MHSFPVIPLPVRRGSAARAALVASLLAVALAPSSCKRTSSATSDQSLAPATGAGVDPPARVPVGDSAANRPGVTFVVTDLPAMFDAIEAISERWLGDAPLDPKSQLQAAMLAMGYAPTLWEQVDPAGPHGMYVHDVGSSDATVAFSVRVAEPGRLAESMGGQSIGPGRWSLESPGSQLVLQADGARLDAGTSSAAIDDLHRRMESVPGTHNLRVRFDDASGIFRDQVTSGPPWMQQLYASIKTLDVSADLRPDADFVSLVTASFDALADPKFLGPLITGPTALERRVGQGAFAVAAWSVLEDLAPWRESATSSGHRVVFESFVTALAGTGREIVVAGHPDGPAAVAFVAGMEVDDAELRRPGLVNALGTALTLAGADHRSTKIAGAAADVWTLELERAEGITRLLAPKGKLTVVAVVHDGVALLAAGSHARKRLAASLRAPNSSADAPNSVLGGLAEQQRSLEGCHLCVAIEPTDALSYGLRGIEHGGGPDTSRTDAARQAALVAKLGESGPVTVGLRMDDHTIGMGLSLPRALVFAPTKDARVLSEAFARLGKFEGAEVVEATEKFTDEICACQDMDCVQAVTVEMAAWAEAHKDAQGTEAQAKQIEALTERMTTCMTDLATRPQ